MHIIALAWIYVVSMMAITETSVMAGIITFACYCGIPLGIIWYLVNFKKIHHATNNTTAQQDNELKRQRHDSSKTAEKLEPDE